MAHDATPGKAATPAPAGWLERLARTSAVGGDTVPPDAALRPRLPYPFEAMKFGTDEAETALPRHGADRWPAASLPPARQDDVQPGGAHYAPPATAQGGPAVHEAHEAAHEGIHAAPHDAAPAVMPAGERPAIRPVDAPAPAGPHHAPPPGAAPSPGTARLARQPGVRAAPPPVDERDDGLAPAGPAYPASAAPLAAAGTRPPADARREIVAPHAVTATPRPAPGDASHDPARRAIVSQPSANAPATTLRSAAVLQTPLPANPAREAAPDITIDIQIGRIEVRAPSGPAPAAPAPAAAPTPRAGDALQAYLLRRGRGARS